MFVTTARGTTRALLKVVLAHRQSSGYQRSRFEIRCRVMRRHDVGPRRSRSVDAYLRRTRVLAVVALLALGGGVVSDTLGGTFWTRHALLAGLAASVIIVMLSV